jgi:hypothetical protein
VRLRAPKETIGKAANLVDAVQPGFGAQVRSMSRSMGLVISNPTMAGVDDAKDWFMAVYPAGNDEPGVVYMIPARDVAKMKAALAEDVKFFEHGGYGVYTNNERAAEITAAHVKEKGAGIAAAMDSECTKSFGAGDISVFVNVPGLLKTYASDFEKLQTRAREAIDKMDADDLPPGIDGTLIKSILKPIFADVVNGISGVNGIVMNITVSRAGIGSETLVRVKEGSPADKFLARHAGSALPALNTLPAGNSFYYGARIDFTSLAGLVDKVVGAVKEGDIENEEVKKMVTSLKAVMAEARGLKLGDMVAAGKVAQSDEGMMSSVSYMESPDARKWGELSRKIAALSGEISQGPVKQKFDFKPAAEKVEGVDVDVTTMKMEAEGDGPEVEIIGRFSRLLYGENGMVSRTAVLKDRIVQTQGGGSEAMAAAIKAAGSSSTKNVAVEKARANMVEKPNFIVLFDLPGFVASLGRIASTIDELPVKIDPETIDALNLTESYIGWSIGTEKQGLRSRAFIPVEQAQGIQKLAMYGFALYMQAQNAGDDEDDE